MAPAGGVPPSRPPIPVQSLGHDSKAMSELERTSFGLSLGSIAVVVLFFVLFYLGLMYLDNRVWYVGVGVLTVALLAVLAVFVLLTRKRNPN
jgi:hypothetical protein